MTLWEALGLGVLQGVTEFLPISSSGHLALAQVWLADLGEPDLLFGVVVHLGTLLAVALVLRRRLVDLCRGAWSFVGSGGRRSELETARRWVLLIAVATLPTAVLGLGARELVVAMNARPPWVGVALLCTALLLLGCERFGRRERGAAELTLGDALLVGVAQGFGVLPGISRSGVTVAASLFRDVRADVAVEFSLLISVPAILGANLLEALAASGAVRGEAGPLAVGFAAAFATGAASIKALQWAVGRRRLIPFASYCALLGAGAVALG